MFVHPSQMAYTGIPGLRAIGQAGTSPTTHSSQNPVIMTISPPLHGNKGQRSPKWRRRSRNREQECLALADVQRERERELICQLSQLKQSIRDLVYHIRACKTSVSQHGCPLLLIFFFDIRFIDIFLCSGNR